MNLILILDGVVWVALVVIFVGIAVYARRAKTCARQAARAQKEAEICLGAILRIRDEREAEARRP